MLDISKKRFRFRMVVPSYPAFNIYSHIAKTTTALGPVCVASVVNKMPGWDVEVIDENNFHRYGPRDINGAVDHEYLQKLRPADVVGLYGGLTSTIPRLYEIARFCKERTIITVAGGQHFVENNIADALNHGIDYVAIGEGEETIRELLEALEGRRAVREVKGIAYLEKGETVQTPPRELLTDFDTLPLPNFSLVRYARIKLYPVGRIRGCGMDCEFCTVKGKPRCASPERLIEDISSRVEINSARHFFIVDDLFGQQRDETIRFCAMLRDYQRKIGRRLDITVQIRLDKAKDTQLLHAMRQAGINTVAIGFESPIEEELAAMQKHVKPQDMIELARVYHRFGFLVHGMFIFGYPMKEGVTFCMPAEERVKRYRTFIKKAKIDTVQVLLPVPLPGTEFTHRLARQNRIYSRKDIGWEYYDGNFPVIVPDAPMTPEQLQLCAHKIMGKFYRFRYMFMVGLHILSFPSMIFFLHNIRAGWNRWYRHWRNSVIRFGGWVIMKGWIDQFKKGSFSEQLKKAQERLKTRP